MRTWRPDALVLEAGLVVPGTRRMYRFLRRQGDVPVIAVIQGRRADEGIEADGYMCKPLTSQRLLERLQVMLVEEEPTHLCVGEVVLHLERTRHIDIVCPRSSARVRHGSDAAGSRRDWSGVAPEVEKP